MGMFRSLILLAVVGLTAGETDTRDTTSRGCTIKVNDVVENIPFGDYQNSANPCLAGMCGKDGVFSKKIIDCAKEMGIPCDGEYVPVKGQCCSECKTGAGLRPITPTCKERKYRRSNPRTCLDQFEYDTDQDDKRPALFKDCCKLKASVTGLCVSEVTCDEGDFRRDLKKGKTKAECCEKKLEVLTEDEKEAQAKEAKNAIDTCTATKTIRKCVQARYEKEKETLEKDTSLTEDQKAQKQKEARQALKRAQDKKKSDDLNTELNKISACEKNRFSKACREQAEKELEKKGISGSDLFEATRIQQNEEINSKLEQEIAACGGSRKKCFEKALVVIADAKATDLGLTKEQVIQQAKDERALSGANSVRDCVKAYATANFNTDPEQPTREEIAEAMEKECGNKGKDACAESGCKASEGAAQNLQSAKSDCIKELEVEVGELSDNKKKREFHKKAMADCRAVAETAFLMSGGSKKDFDKAAIKAREKTLQDLDEACDPSTDSNCLAEVEEEFLKQGGKKELFAVTRKKAKASKVADQKTSCYERADYDRSLSKAEKNAAKRKCAETANSDMLKDLVKTNSKGKKLGESFAKQMLADTTREAAKKSACGDDDDIALCAKKAAKFLQRNEGISAAKAAQEARELEKQDKKNEFDGCMESQGANDEDMTADERRVARTHCMADLAPKEDKTKSATQVKREKKRFEKTIEEESKKEVFGIYATCMLEAEEGKEKEQRKICEEKRLENAKKQLVGIDFSDKKKAMKKLEAIARKENMKQKVAAQLEDLKNGGRPNLEDDVVDGETSALQEPKKKAFIREVKQTLGPLLSSCMKNLGSGHCTEKAETSVEDDEIACSVMNDKDSCEAVELSDDPACTYDASAKTCTETAKTSIADDKTSCEAVSGTELDDEVACLLVQKTTKAKACKFTALMRAKKMKMCTKELRDEMAGLEEFTGDLDVLKNKEAARIALEQELPEDATTDEIKETIAENGGVAADAVPLVREAKKRALMDECFQEATAVVTAETTDEAEADVDATTGRRLLNANPNRSPELSEIVAEPDLSARDLQSLSFREDAVTVDVAACTADVDAGTCTGKDGVGDTGCKSVQTRVTKDNPLIKTECLSVKLTESEISAKRKELKDERAEAKTTRENRFQAVAESDCVTDKTQDDTNLVNDRLSPKQEKRKALLAGAAEALDCFVAGVAEVEAETYVAQLDRREVVKEVADTIKSCMEDAADATARKACTAKDTLAIGLGKATADVSDSELNEYMEAAASHQTSETIQACMQSATDSTARQACKETAKKSLASALGKDAHIPEPEIDEFLRRGARETVKTDMRACMEASADAASRAACKAGAQATVAAALGKATISDSEFDEVVRGAENEQRRMKKRRVDPVRQRCTQKLQEYNDDTEDLPTNPRYLLKKAAGRKAKEHALQIIKESPKGTKYEEVETKVESAMKETLSEDFMDLYDPGQLRRELNDDGKRKFSNKHRNKIEVEMEITPETGADVDGNTIRANTEILEANARGWVKKMKGENFAKLKDSSIQISATNVVQTSPEDSDDPRFIVSLTIEAPVDLTKEPENMEELDTIAMAAGAILTTGTIPPGDESLPAEVRELALLGKALEAQNELREENDLSEKRTEGRRRLAETTKFEIYVAEEEQSLESGDEVPELVDNSGKECSSDADCGGGSCKEGKCDSPFEKQSPTFNGAFTLTATFASFVLAMC